MISPLVRSQNELLAVYGACMLQDTANSHPHEPATLLDVKVVMPEAGQVVAGGGGVAELVVDVEVVVGYVVGVTVMLMTGMEEEVDHVEAEEAG